MNVYSAILTGAAAIAVALLICFHWEVTTSGNDAYRLNRWTGVIERCSASDAGKPGTTLPDTEVDYRCVVITPVEPQPGEQLQVK